MPFKKGKSGNPNGRPAGKQNKATVDLRGKVNKLVTDNFEQLQADLAELEPRDRVKFYIDLLQYSLPKLQSTHATIEDNDAQPLNIVAQSQAQADHIKEMIEEFKERDVKQ